MGSHRWPTDNSRALLGTTESIRKIVGLASNWATLSTAGGISRQASWFGPVKDLHQAPHSLGLQQMRMIYVHS